MNNFVSIASKLDPYFPSEFLISVFAPIQFKFNIFVFFAWIIFLCDSKILCFWKGPDGTDNYLLSLASNIICHPICELTNLVHTQSCHRNSMNKSLK